MRCMRCAAERILTAAILTTEHPILNSKHHHTAVTPAKIKRGRLISNCKIKSSLNRYSLFLNVLAEKSCFHKSREYKYI